MLRVPCRIEEKLTKRIERIEDSVFGQPERNSPDVVEKLMVKATLKMLSSLSRSTISRVKAFQHCSHGRRRPLWTNCRRLRAAASAGAGGCRWRCVRPARRSPSSQGDLAIAEVHSQLSSMYLASAEAAGGDRHADRQRFRNTLIGWGLGWRGTLRAGQAGV